MSNLINVNKDTLRDAFQPSRVVLGVVNDYINNRLNIITLAFNMFGAYTPLRFVLAVHNINHSYELFEKSQEYVISIPGENIYKETMFCGTKSGRAYDKFAATGLTPLKSEKISTVGIKECIANLECIKKEFIKGGDHAVVIGEVVNARRDITNNQRNIISIASNLNGYELLIKQGELRLGVVKHSG